MKATITFLRTGHVKIFDVVGISYTTEKIILYDNRGGFESYCHGDKGVKIEFEK